MTRSLARRASLFAATLAVATVSLTGCFQMPMAGGGGGGTSGGGGGRTELMLINNTGVPIYYVYISPCSSSSWGDDQLGSNVVMPGNTWTWTMNAGCYDLKAVDRDGREAVERRVQISGSGKRWTLS